MFGSRREASFGKDQGFDPAACFGDPFAAEVDWATRGEDGIGYAPRSVIQNSAQRLELRPSSWLEIFLEFLPLSSLAGLFLLAVAHGSEWITRLCGLMLLLWGLWSVWRKSAPWVFDLAEGVASKGRAAGRSWRIDQIHAVQLVTKLRLAPHRDPTNRSGPRFADERVYQSWLVLRDGKRLPLAPYASDQLDCARAQAKQIAVFLSRPLWDATAAEPIARL